MTQDPSFTGTIRGVPYRYTTHPSSGGVSCSVSFEVDGNWTAIQSVAVVGILSSEAEAYMLGTQFERATSLEDFIPWAPPSPMLHFNIWVDGHRCQALVSRECLVEKCIADMGGERERFAVSRAAERLRELAADKIRAGQTPTIQASDWR